MPVRPTENRLPAGLVADDLGQSAKKCNYLLVSYMTRQLRYADVMRPLTKTYAVFDNDSTCEFLPNIFCEAEDVEST